MKIGLTHFAGGIVLGLMIILIPLIALAELDVQNRISQPSYSQSKSLSDEFRGIEGSYGSGTSITLVTDLGPLAVSFVVAIAVYMVVRRRMPSRDHGSP